MSEIKVSIGNSFSELLYFLFSLFIANIGYTIHHSVFWTIVDFLFAPIVLIKWIIYHEITLSVIQQSFSWFFN